MNKKYKLYLILTISSLMIAWWALLFFTDTREQTSNYLWQVCMGLTALLFGAFGIATAAKWGWLKSGVGRGVFFMSLALIFWGIGQMAWSYYLFAGPDTETPTSHLLDIIDFSAIPLWFYGIIELSRATGAKYGLKKWSGKLLVVVISLIMILLSYYFLVEVARGGDAYFDQTFWKSFFDLGYSIGDAIIATAAITIFVLSWKFLGGRFRLPIVMILVGFVLLFLADFSYSYYEGIGEYYNGNITDLLFILMITAMGLGLNMLDPNHVRSKKQNNPAAEVPVPDVPEVVQIDNSQPDKTSDTDEVSQYNNPVDHSKVNPVAPYAQPHDNEPRNKVN